MKQMLPLFQKTSQKFTLTLLMLIFAGTSIFAQNADEGGEVGSDQTICPMTPPALLTNEDDASGGDPNLAIQYLWMMTDDFNNNISSWMPATGDNDNPNYQPPALDETTYFVRCARRAGFMAYPAESNIVTVTVRPGPVTQINGNPGIVFSGTTVNLTASPTPPSAATPGFTPTYTFDANGDGIVDCIGLDCSFTYNMTGTFNIVLTVNDGQCTKTQTQTIEVIVDPLPVELASFEGKVVDKNIQLKWVTLSESNNSHFEIEKSTDGIRFENIGKEESYGNGTAPETQIYNFEDEQVAAGIYYYQLKQVDFDGEFEYSDMITVRVTADDSGLLVTPNPVQDVAQVELPNFTPNTFIEVISTTGQVVKVIEVQSNQQEIQMGDLPNGIYFLRLKSSSWVQNLMHKVVKF